MGGTHAILGGNMDETVLITVNVLVLSVRKQQEKNDRNSQT